MGALSLPAADDLALAVCDRVIVLNDAEWRVDGNIVVTRLTSAEATTAARRQRDHADLVITTLEGRTLAESVEHLGTAGALVRRGGLLALLVDHDSESLTRLFARKAGAAVIDQVAVADAATGTAGDSADDRQLLLVEPSVLLGAPRPVAAVAIAIVGVGGAIRADGWFAAAPDWAELSAHLPIDEAELIELAAALDPDTLLIAVDPSIEPSTRLIERLVARCPDGQIGCAAVVDRNGTIRHLGLTDDGSPWGIGLAATHPLTRPDRAPVRLSLPLVAQAGDLQPGRTGRFLGGVQAISTEPLPDAGPQGTVADAWGSPLLILLDDSTEDADVDELVAELEAAGLAAALWAQRARPGRQRWERAGFVYLSSADWGGDAARSIRTAVQLLQPAYVATDERLADSWPHLVADMADARFDATTPAAAVAAWTAAITQGVTPRWAGLTAPTGTAIVADPPAPTGTAIVAGPMAPTGTAIVAGPMAPTGTAIVAADDEQPTLWAIAAAARTASEVIVCDPVAPAQRCAAYAEAVGHARQSPTVVSWLNWDAHDPAARAAFDELDSGPVTFVDASTYDPVEPAGWIRLAHAVEQGVRTIERSELAEITAAAPGTIGRLVAPPHPAPAGPTTGPAGRGPTPPFVIATPGYTPTSSGIGALRRLTHELNELGYRASVALYAHSDRLHPHWNTPLATRADLDDGIVVYPETLLGNPLGARRVSRWLLNKPGNLGPACDLPPDEFVFSYAEFIDNTRPILYMPMIDPTVVYPKSRPGRGAAVYGGKGVADDRFDRFNPVVLQRDFTTDLAELAEFFRSIEVLFSFDSWSFTNITALLCGTPVIIVADHQGGREECVGQLGSDAGMAWWGVDDWDRAYETVAEAYPTYLATRGAIDVPAAVEAWARQAIGYPYSAFTEPSSPLTVSTSSWSEQTSTSTWSEQTSTSSSTSSL